MHSIYAVAIKTANAWDHFTTLEMFSLAYWNLKHVWLKLLIIWRHARFWTLVDGFDPPENMLRCMSNNYSGMAFWRSWHQSFNLWNIRYLYIPMGGRKWAFLNIWVIFTFVALWHDRELDRLVWGWLICVLLLPEILGTFMARKLGLETLPYYRHLAALGGALNVYTMCIANMIGFVVGVDGTIAILEQAFTWQGKLLEVDGPIPSTM